MRKELRIIISFILVGIFIGVYFLFVGVVWYVGGGAMGRQGAYIYIPVGGIIIFLTVLGGILAYRRSHRE
jgi:hypothetical protein